MSMHHSAVQPNSGQGRDQGSYPNPIDTASPFHNFSRASTTTPSHEKPSNSYSEYFPRILLILIHIVEIILLGNADTYYALVTVFRGAEVEMKYTPPGIILGALICMSAQLSNTLAATLAMVWLGFVFAGKIHYIDELRSQIQQLKLQCQQAEAAQVAQAIEFDSLVAGKNQELEEQRQELEDQCRELGEAKRRQHDTEQAKATAVAGYEGMKQVLKLKQQAHCRTKRVLKRTCKHFRDAKRNEKEQHKQLEEINKRHLHELAHEQMPAQNLSQFTSLSDLNIDPRTALLGVGAFGEVRAARDARTYAIKKQICSLESANEIEILKLARAAAFVTRWRGSFVVVEDGLDVSYIVMDMCTGGTLRDMITRFGGDALPASLTVSYMCELVAGIAHLHDLGILHRDINTQNLLLDAAGHLCIADFGLSEILPPGSSYQAGANTLSGTPSYMPPEVLGPAPDIFVPHGFGFDAYACGIVFFQMLTGVTTSMLAFDEALNDTLGWGLGSGPMHVVQHTPLSEDALDLLAKLVHPDPNSRFQARSQIKEHRYFGGIDWDCEVEGRRMPVETEASSPLYRVFGQLIGRLVGFGFGR
jgi:tRNA A-37 threonylcarbamoyl transferase component Bud32